MTTTTSPLASRKKRTFVVRESKYQAGVKKRWRRPRGIHSAVRQRHAGRPALPHPGYGRPAAVRGLHRSGVKPVLVSRVEELLALNPKSEGAIISATLGTKKKVELLVKALDKKIMILNVKDVPLLLEKLKSSFAARKTQRAEREKRKNLKEEEKRKKAEEKKKKEESEKSKEKTDEKSVEERVKEEQEKQKEIVEKTLTKRQ